MNKKYDGGSREGYTPSHHDGEYNRQRGGIMAATSLRKAIAGDISMVMNALTVITACSKSIATAAMAHSAVDFSVVASNGRTVKAMADSAEVSSVTASSGDPGTLTVAISSAEATAVATAHSRVAMASSAVTVSSVAESLHPSSVRTLENVALTIKSSPMTPMSRFA